MARRTDGAGQRNRDSVQRDLRGTAHRRSRAINTSSLARLSWAQRGQMSSIFLAF